MRVRDRDALAAARIYDACHAGLTLVGITHTTGLPHETVKATLAKFLRLKLLLQVEDHYLSLALRPRDELLRRFLVMSSTDAGDRAPGSQARGIRSAGR